MKTLTEGHSGLQQNFLPACRAHGVTHKGRVRSGNEDAYLSNPDAGVFVVCDGMGGAAAGEVASHLAAEAANHILARASAQATMGKAAMQEAVAAANKTVYQRANSDRRLEGMGTTLVTLALLDGHALVAHVGDSRCYLWRAGVLERLTADHSLVEEQVRLGQITRRQAERSSLAHVITRAIGTAPDVAADVSEVAMQAGDVFLLATDGLTKELTEEEVSMLLAHSHSEEAVAEGLVLAANTAGGRDNITCIVVRIL